MLSKNVTSVIHRILHNGEWDGIHNTRAVLHNCATHVVSDIRNGKDFVKWKIYDPSMYLWEPYVVFIIPESPVLFQHNMS